MSKSIELSWDNITISQYAEIDKYRRAEGYDLMQKGIAILSVITGKKVEELEKLPISHITNQIKVLYDWLNQPIEPKLLKSFKAGGRKFNLYLDTENLTYGDFEQISLLKITEDTLSDKCPAILAQLSKEHIPTFRKFRTPLTFKEKEQLFRSLPASIGMAVALFFYNLANELQPIVLEKLNQDIEDLNKMMK